MILNRFPFTFLWIFVFVVPMENSLYFEGFGAISRIVGLMAMFAAILTLAISKKVRKIPNILFLLFLFVLLGAISYYWSYFPPATIQWVKTLLQMLGLFWLVWEYTAEEKQLVALFWAFVCGSFVSALGVFWSLYQGKSAFLSEGRFVQEGFDPNELGITLAISIVIAVYLTTRNSLRSKQSISAWAFIFIAIVAIFLTASRSAFICLLISLAYIPVMSAKIGFIKKSVIIAFFITILLNVQKFIPTTTFERINSIYDSIAFGGLNQRVSIWKAGFDLLLEDTFFGVGAGAFVSAVHPLFGRQAVAHNTFLSILFELGLVGFSLFVVFIVILINRIAQARHDYRAFLFFLLFCWSIGAMTLTWEYSKVTWLVFSFVFSASYLWACDDSQSS